MSLTVDDLNEPHFLERRRQRKALKDAYDEAKRGHKRVVLLTGETGVGKSRLFREFRDGDISSTQKVFEARFAEEKSEIRGRPLMLMMSAIYREFGKLPDELTRSDMELEVDLGTLEFIIANFKEESEDDFMASVAGGESAFFSAMTGFLVAHAQRKPLNLLFENLECADLTSARFLEFFSTVPEAEGAHLFVVMTHATDKRDPSNHFYKLSGKVTRQELVETIEVPPLRALSVPSFFQTVVGRLKAEDKVYDEAFNLSKGNPSMLLAVIRGFVEKGVIIKTSHGWEISPDAEISALPKEMEEQLIAGAKGQGKKHRDSLEWSAVAGHEFDANLITSVSNVAGTHFGFVMSDLTRDRYWDEVEGKTRVWVFPSPAVRKAIYESIKEKRRVKMHLTIARELEKRDPPPADQLAEHYALAKQPKQEQTWALRAGAAAYRSVQFSTAQAHFARVLELLGEQRKPSDAELAEVHWWLARTHRRKRELSKAEEHIRDGLRHGRAAREAFVPELKAEQALIKLARRDYSAIEQIKAALGSDTPLAQNPELIVAFADMHRLKNRVKSAADWLAKIDKKHPDFRAAEGGYRLGRGRLAYFQGNWPVAAKELIRAEEVFREQKSFDRLGQALFSLAELRYAEGKIPVALGLVENAIQYVADLGDPSVEARLRGFEALLLQKYGQAEESLESLKLARKLAKKAARERITAYVLLDTARWSAHLRDYAKGISAGRKALEVFENLPDRWGAAGAYAALARLYVRADNLEQANQYFKFAIKYYRELGGIWQGAYLGPSWSKVAGRAGNAKKQAKLLKEGLDFAGKYNMPEAKGLLLVEMGRLTSDRQKAVEWFHAAYLLLRNCGNRMDAKRARMLYLREKDASKDEGAEARQAAIEAVDSGEVDIDGSQAVLSME